MEKGPTLKHLRAIARRIAQLDAKREALVTERDALMREAKAQGATWEELQTAAGMSSPTAVARALKRGA